MSDRSIFRNTSKKEGTSTQSFSRQSTIDADRVGYPGTPQSSRSRANSASINKTERQNTPKESDNTSNKKTGTRDSGKADEVALSQKIEENRALGTRLLRADDSVLLPVLNDMKDVPQRALETIRNTKYMRFFSVKTAEKRHAAFRELGEYASKSESLGEFGKLYGEAQGCIEKLDKISPLGLTAQAFNQYVRNLPTIKQHIGKLRDKFVTNYCKDHQRFKGEGTEASEENYRENTIEKLTNDIGKLKTIINSWEKGRLEATESFPATTNEKGEYGRTPETVYSSLSLAYNVTYEKIKTRETNPNTGETDIYERNLNRKEKDDARNWINQIQKLCGIVRGRNYDQSTREMACMVLERELDELYTWVATNWGVTRADDIWMKEEKKGEPSAISPGLSEKEEKALGKQNTIPFPSFHDSALETHETRNEASPSILIPTNEPRVRTRKSARQSARQSGRASKVDDSA